MIRWFGVLALLVLATGCMMIEASMDDLDLQGYQARALGADGATFTIVEEPDEVFRAVEQAFRDEGRLDASWPESRTAHGTTSQARLFAEIREADGGGTHAVIRSEPLAGYTPRGEEAVRFARSVLTKIARP